MKYALLSILILTLTSCVVSVDALPDPTPILPATSQPASPTLIMASATPVVVPALPPGILLDDIPVQLTAIPENFNPDICQDTRALQLLQDLRTAIQTRNGEQLAALVSPASGVGVRYLREGNVITYFDNIKFIFETTYEADWGLGAGSGLPVTGSFQQIVLPSLDITFTSNSVIACNELKVGGATYTPAFPYNGMDYYSVHFPGSDQYSGMDWETWAVGMVRQEGKPMLAALIHFAWEP